MCSSDLGEDGLDDSLVDVIQTEETEVRPAPGALKRVSIIRQTESIAKQLHKAETRARSLRADLGLTPASRARLGRDILAAGRPDLALFWAELDAEDDRARAGQPSQ